MPEFDADGKQSKENFYDELEQYISKGKIDEDVAALIGRLAAIVYDNKKKLTTLQTDYDSTFTISAQKKIQNVKNGYKIETRSSIEFNYACLLKNFSSKC